MSGAQCCLNQRVANHRAACASDPLSCPFYREATQRHGGLDGYTFEILAEIPNLPQDRNAARQQLCTLEMTMIEMSRAAGHDLWNHRIRFLVVPAVDPSPLAVRDGTDSLRLKINDYT